MKVAVPSTKAIQTTQRYLGVELDLQDAPCDHLGFRMPSGAATAVQDQRGHMTAEEQGTRRHRFLDAKIDLPADLTEAQLDGRACIRCGAEDTPKRPVGAWSELSSQLFECVDVEGCGRRVEQEHD